MAHTSSTEITTIKKAFPHRPPKYDEPDDLAKVFFKYFSSLDGNPPTITGLALHAGFASRQSMYDLAKQKKFSYVIDRARLLIENYHERVVFAEQNPGHSIEWLRQNDERDEGREGEAALRVEVVAVAATITPSKDPG